MGNLYLSILRLQWQANRVPFPLYIATKPPQKTVAIHQDVCRYFLSDAIHPLNVGELTTTFRPSKMLWLLAFN